MYNKYIPVRSDLIDLIVDNGEVFLQINGITGEAFTYLTIEDAKRVRNYLEEAINFATIGREEVPK